MIAYYVRKHQLGVLPLPRATIVFYDSDPVKEGYRFQEATGGFNWWFPNWVDAYGHLEDHLELALKAYCERRKQWQ